MSGPRPPRKPVRATLRARLRLLAGLLLLGQGFLVLSRILDHEAPPAVGIACLASGIGLLAWPHRTGWPDGTRTGTSSPAGSGRVVATATIGAAATVGVLAYNGATGSGLSPPEWAILAYGTLLLLAAPRLAGRVGPLRIGQLVSYSFPVVLAPLSLYALDAAVASSLGARPLGAYVELGLVRPMGAILEGLGLDITVSGSTIRLEAAGSPMYLGVGVVCAGLYAGVIFLGVFALFAWEARTPPLRLAAYVAVGLAGIHAANVVRLVLLALVGHAWGAPALQAFHTHAGWVLFLLWSLLFWAVVLRRLEGARAPPKVAQG